jgi:15-cis-phytoene synthase
VPAFNPTSPDALGISNAACEQITRRQARNFYYGLRLTPQPKRAALYAIYAWMRRADDIADDSPNADAGLRELALFRRQTERAMTGENPDAADPRWPAFIAAARDYALDAASFRLALDAMEFDLRGPTVPDDERLLWYCRAVASTVGVLCTQVWGCAGTGRGEALTPEVRGLAERRGVAFQMTNILRDFATDFDLSPSRVYVPTSALSDARMTAGEIRRWSSPKRCADFVRSFAARARREFDASRGLEDAIHPDGRATLKAMTAIYRAILQRVEQEPVLCIGETPASLPTARKVAIAARFGLGALLRGSTANCPRFVG